MSDSPRLQIVAKNLGLKRTNMLQNRTNGSVNTCQHRIDTKQYKTSQNPVFPNIFPYFLQRCDSLNGELMCWE